MVCVIEFILLSCWWIIGWQLCWTGHYVSSKGHVSIYHRHGLWGYIYHGQNCSCNIEFSFSFMGFLVNFISSSKLVVVHLFILVDFLFLRNGITHVVIFDLPVQYSFDGIEGTRLLIFFSFGNL